MRTIVRKRAKHNNPRTQKLNCIYTRLPIGTKVEIVTLDVYRNIIHLLDLRRDIIDKIRDLV